MMEDWESLDEEASEAEEVSDETPSTVRSPSHRRAPEIGNRFQHGYNLRSSGAAGTARSPTQP